MCLAVEYQPRARPWQDNAATIKSLNTQYTTLNLHRIYMTSSLDIPCLPLVAQRAEWGSILDIQLWQI